MLFVAWSVSLLVMADSSKCIGTFADVYTSRCCEPVETFYRPFVFLEPMPDDETTLRGADYFDIYWQPDCIAIESLYAFFDVVDHHKPVPLGAVSVHGDRVIHMRNNIEMSAPKRLLCTGFADIYSKPDCVPIETLYDLVHASDTVCRADDHKPPVPLGAFSVHGDSAIYMRDAHPTATAAPRSTLPSCATPLCRFTVHGTLMLLQSGVSQDDSHDTPATQSMPRTNSADTLNRKKSWKDLSLDSVVDQAMCFCPNVEA